MTLAQETLDAFLSSIASENIAPGGGSAAAVVGATGTALCEMVCIQTPGDEDLAGRRADLEASRDRLMELAETDRRLVDENFGGGTVSLDQSDFKRLTGVPLSIAEEAGTVLETATVVVAEGNENAVADGIVGATVTKGALDAAVFTARCNLPYLEDDDYVSETSERLDAIEAAATADMETIRSRRAAFT